MKSSYTNYGHGNWLSIINTLPQWIVRSIAICALCFLYLYLSIICIHLHYKYVSLNVFFFIYNSNEHFLLLFKMRPCKAFFLSWFLLFIHTYMFLKCSRTGHMQTQTIHTAIWARVKLLWVLFFVHINLKKKLKLKKNTGQMSYEII